jgi:hypothetical protein
MLIESFFDAAMQKKTILGTIDFVLGVTSENICHERLS